MTISWLVIPHADQRYETCGDYWEDGSTAYFRTSKLSDPKHDWILFLHEFVEYFLCKFAGIAIKDIDDWDTAYEAARAVGYANCGCEIQDEPGMDRHALYYWHHRMADLVERAAAFALGVDWIAYSREIEAL